MRVGIGYDLHKLVEGRPLVLGGVAVDYHKGLLGYSDGDVLLHAIADAILGSVGMGDIGQHFPDTDPKYKGISSLKLLDEVAKKTGQLASVYNIDATIICQEPKLHPYIDDMRKKVASILTISADRVSIKATTTEGLGPEGQGDAIAAQAVVLVEDYKGEDYI
ncbi:2-C-methyl-D-erythritol 2,4-cyclodiphosphate synthase [candidate division TA06 bacterium]|uniref:2-C-methyl-D-erythritol 2,4-cyclodiphosphate synthase n=1 Tax=candidate division TA06 bacterium TaxID=2250710 RepID=A0A523UR74_UNCT6|nr:MAG: 2-C-methyl-D-erythritol 2,4-cyclodiphosphate synthase [candidate division TA06 bacterium]